MAAARADLDAVQTEHALVDTPADRASRVAVAVVGEDDELESGARGRRGDVLGRAAAVGALGMDVKGARHDADRRQAAGEGDACGRQRDRRSKTATAARRAAVANSRTLHGRRLA